MMVTEVWATVHARPVQAPRLEVLRSFDLSAERGASRLSAMATVQIRACALNGLSAMQSKIRAGCGGPLKTKAEMASSRHP